MFKESAGKALVEVKRLNGCSGKASVNWQTKDRDGKGAAVDGRDYVGGSGVLAFEHGELVKTIEIEIIDDQVHRHVAKVCQIPDSYKLQFAAARDIHNRWRKVGDSVANNL